ncbi:MAG: hypothetical protein JNL70_07715 [Saprospiraceae bacterium]|nr:hypothetical protein [Saprospiraceae bacterium]
MKRLLPVLLAFSTVFFVSCDDDNSNEDKVETKDISRNGAIETQITTEHLPDSRDVLVTSHKVWKNGVLERELRHTDTIPALGTGSLPAADVQGNATTATGQKDYEFYITVK